MPCNHSGVSGIVRILIDRNPTDWRGPIDRQPPARYCRGMKRFSLWMRSIVWVVWIAPSLLTGCSTGGDAKRLPDGMKPICAILDGDVRRTGRAVRIALADKPVLVAAPVPSNESERVLFRALYETPVDVRCDGVVVPSLAESWTGPDSAGVWTIVLRKGARFSDGSPLLARHVIESWEKAGHAPRPTPGQGGPAGSTMNKFVFRAVGERAVAIDPGLYTHLFPEHLAHPEFAVVRSTRRGAAPTGSGPWMIANGNVQERGKTVCLRNRYYPAPPSGSDSLIFDFRNAGLDARDLPFGELDMVVLRERQAVSFASALPSFADKPLPWDRTYVLILRHTPNKGPLRALLNRPGFLESLARDVVGEDARAVTPEMADRLDLKACAPEKDGRDGNRSKGTFQPGLILYPEDDPNAAGIAARIAALARNPGDHLPSIIATKMTKGESPDFRPEDTSAIVHLLRVPVAEICTGADSWLQSVPPNSGFHRKDFLSPDIVPLVESRPHLFAREGLAGLSLDGNANLLLLRAGWTEGIVLP